MVTAAMKSKSLTLWKKSILKSRDITIPTKVHVVKAMVFPDIDISVSYFS